MPTVFYQDVLDRARVPINDAAKVRYTDDELNSYLNDGILAMVGPRADLFVFDGTMSTVAGTVNQTLPAGGISVMDVYAATAGGVSRGVSRMLFDDIRTFRQTWRTDPAAICQNWLYAPQDPDKVSGPAFMIYPQAPAGQVLNVIYLKAPVRVATALAATTILPIADTYSVPLQAYVAGRAELKDDEHVNSGRAELLLKTFLEQIAALDKGEDASP